MSLRTVVPAVVLLTILATTASAGTVDLTATGDAMLFGGSYANTKYGGDPLMGIWWGSARQKSLVKFDLSSFGSGSTVISATLTLYVDGHGGSDNWGNQYNKPMDLYRLTDSWVEDEVTWNRRSDAEAWSAAGANYVGTTGGHETNPYATSTQSVSTPGDPITWDVTDLVSEWIDGTSTNHGLIIMSRNYYDWNQAHFRTLEHKAGSAYYPTLTVTVVPLPGAAVAGLGLLTGLGAVSFIRRRRQTR